MMENYTEKSEPIYVPYIVHRDAVSHDRWIIRRLITALIICVVLMFASNAAWLYVWNQYDYSSEETIVDSDGNGIANYTGGDGGVIYGESDRPQEVPDAQ